MLKYSSSSLSIKFHPSTNETHFIFPSSLNSQFQLKNLQQYCLFLHKNCVSKNIVLTNLFLAEYMCPQWFTSLQRSLRCNHPCSCRWWRCEPCQILPSQTTVELLSRLWLWIREAHSLQPFYIAVRVQKEQRWESAWSLHNYTWLSRHLRLCCR